VKALPGSPYDGHTVATVIPNMEALVGNTPERILTDKGYRGHNAPPDYNTNKGQETESAWLRLTSGRRRLRDGRPVIKFLTSMRGSTPAQSQSWRHGRYIRFRLLVGSIKTLDFGIMTQLGHEISQRTPRLSGF
jgi:hypothetical protein